MQKILYLTVGVGCALAIGGLTGIFVNPNLAEAFISLASIGGGIATVGIRALTKRQRPY